MWKVEADFGVTGEGKTARGRYRSDRYASILYTYGKIFTLTTKHLCTDKQNASTQTFYR